MSDSLFDNPAYSEICSALPSITNRDDEPIFGRLSNGSWLMFDQRIDLKLNTPNSPIDDGGKHMSINTNGHTNGQAFCSNVPRTFLNEYECKLSNNACRANSGRGSQIDIVLNHATIAMLNNLTGRYVYAIEGLLVNYNGIILDHPCTPGLRSRWEQKIISDCNPTELYDATNETLSHLLSGSGDNNPFMRDIYFPAEGTFCDSLDTDPEIEIEVNGECWTRVHPEHMSLFDMTYWVDNHPGGPYAIQKWAENNGTILVYPSNVEGKIHGMSRWNNHWHDFLYVGRFGDTLSLSELSTGLATVDVLNYFGGTQGGGNIDDSNVVICGSPGEVANDSGEELQFQSLMGYRTTWIRLYTQKTNAWIMAGLNSMDQLRQRVSWAMAQVSIFVYLCVLIFLLMSSVIIVNYLTFFFHSN